MNHQYHATVAWSGDAASFSSGKYSRAHKWTFDGGIEIPASASPQVVPLPFSTEEAVDPEEAFVASISSCHMLTFLHLASRQGLCIISYTDQAIGTMTAGSDGRLRITRVTLRPKITFQLPAPDAEELAALHRTAHEECFIANSVKTEITIEAT